MVMAIEIKAIDQPMRWIRLRRMSLFRYIPDPIEVHGDERKNKFVRYERQSRAIEDKPIGDERNLRIQKGVELPVLLTATCRTKPAVNRLAECVNLPSGLL